METSRVLLLLLFFIGCAHASICSNQTCCETLQDANPKTGHGYLEYDAACFEGGENCVENTNCRLCRANWTEPDAAVRPVCGFFIPEPSSECSEAVDNGSPTCVPEERETVDDLVKFIGLRFRNLRGTRNSQHIYLGDATKLGTSDRVQTFYPWSQNPPREHQFTFTWEDDTVTVEMVPGDVTSTYDDVSTKLAGRGDLSTLNVFELAIYARSPDTVIEVKDLRFNDILLGNYRYNGSDNVIAIKFFTGVSFVPPLKITGVLALEGQFLASQEGSRVELILGHSPSVLPACVPPLFDDPKEICCSQYEFPNTDTGHGFLEYDPNCDNGGKDCVERTGCKLCRTPDADGLGDRDVCRRFQREVALIPQRTVTFTTPEDNQDLDVGVKKFIFEQGATIGKASIQASSSAKPFQIWDFGKISSDFCAEVNNLEILFNSKPQVGDILREVITSSCLTSSPSVSASVQNEPCTRVSVESFFNETTLHAEVTSVENACTQQEDSSMATSFSLSLVLLAFAVFFFM